MRRSPQELSYYQANIDSPLFPDLRGLLLKTAGLVDVLTDALKPVASKVVIAFVYGSIASGDEQSDSDVDVTIVGTVPAPDLALSLRRARDLLGRQINPTTYTPAEFYLLGSGALVALRCHCQAYACQTQLSAVDPSCRGTPASAGRI